MLQGERLFDFYNSSARRSFSVYRDLLNLWIEHYPRGERAELVRRFSKGSNAQYAAALAEVIIHEVLLSRPGAIEYHPAVTSSSKRPDFLKHSSDLSKMLYIEVTTCAPAREAEAVGNRVAAIHNAVNNVRLPPGHVLGLSVEESGSHSINLGRLKREVENWAADYHCEVTITQPLSHLFTIDDWRVELTLMKLPDPHKQLDRSIGFLSDSARWIDGSGDIRAGLERKVSRYGQLGAPFLIVVADCKGEVGWGDSAKRELIEALFGDEAVTVWHDLSGEPRFEPKRKLNGLLGHSNSPKNQNLSAVLLLPQPDLWGLRNPIHQPFLIQNPWAHYTLPGSLMPLPSLRLEEDGELHETEGESLADVLGLPKEWPPPF